MATTRFESDDDSEDNLVLPDIYSARKISTLPATNQSPKKYPPAKTTAETKTLSKSPSKPLPKLTQTSSNTSTTSTGSNSSKLKTVKTVCVGMM